MIYDVFKETLNIGLCCCNVKRRKTLGIQKTATSYVFCCLNMLLSLGPLNLYTAGGKQTKVTFLNYTKIISIANVCAEKNINLKNVHSIYYHNNDTCDINFRNI